MPVSALLALALAVSPGAPDVPGMERIVGTAVPFYLLHGGLHSTETGSPEMLMELAYRLDVSNAPHVVEIREKLVVLINPVAEPDGRDRDVDWFYRFLKGKTDYDRLPPLSPPYWGHYVRHDNNRDGIQRKLALTRATQDAFLAWHPAVVHDLHESIPLLTIWTGTGPFNANVDPITAVEIQAFALNEVTALTAFGMPGVWTWGFTEGWSQFYADSVATNHNAIGRGYETFGNATAETVERWIDPERNKFAGRPVTETDWYRSLPAPKRPLRKRRFPRVARATRPARGFSRRRTGSPELLARSRRSSVSTSSPRRPSPTGNGTRSISPASASSRHGPTRSLPAGSGCSSTRSGFLTPSSWTRTSAPES